MGGGKAEGSKVDAGGKGQEAVVGAGKVAGGVVAGGIWRADLEARRGYHSLQVPRSKVLPSLRTFYQKITDNVLLLWTGAYALLRRPSVL